MKQFLILAKNLKNEDDFDFLANCCSKLEIIDRGRFYLNDMSTGARVIAPQDELAFYATAEQETMLRIRFDNLQEL